jgi:hypothetical protein
VRRLLGVLDTFHSFLSSTSNRRADVERAIAETEVGGHEYSRCIDDVGEAT